MKLENATLTLDKDEFELFPMFIINIIQSLRHFKFLGIPRIRYKVQGVPLNITIERHLKNWQIEVHRKKIAKLKSIFVTLTRFWVQSCNLFLMHTFPTNLKFWTDFQATRQVVSYKQTIETIMCVIRLLSKI